jgi:hypothetical protein
MRAEYGDFVDGDRLGETLPVAGPQALKVK